jgi:hypothetical protein
LDIVNTVMSQRIRAGMRVFMWEGEALGAAALGPLVEAGGEQVPGLSLGSQPQANDFTLVDRMQSLVGSTQEAVEAIGSISGVINQINDISNTIASAVEEQSATTNEISRNVAEAAKGVGEITENVTGVSEAVKSTATGAAETRASATELARMAAELQGLVGQFKYGDASERAQARTTHGQHSPQSLLKRTPVYKPQGISLHTL